MEQQKYEEEKKKAMSSCLATLFVLLIIGIVVGSIAYFFSLRKDAPSSEQLDITADMAEPSYQVDSVTISRLIPRFRKSHDDFTGIDYVIPKTAPIYTNQEAFYTYFQIDENNHVSNFRIRVQYTAKEWLFLQKIQFLIKEKEKEKPTRCEFNPIDVKCDNKSDIVWEWFDEPTSVTSPLITSIVNSDSVRMRYVGQQTNKEKALTPSQIQSIKETSELYRAYGGQ